MNIEKRLFELRDIKFRDFNARLIPNIDKETVIGVKTPQLKQLAREVYKSGEYKGFISVLPHKCFEENQLHAFIISQIADFDMAIYELERFLPYVDNWATCDQLIMKAIAKKPEKILDKIDLWLASGKTYTVRFAIGLLMRYFLDERFDKEYLDKVAAVKSDEYYINMMIAWYFATALAKQWEDSVKYIEEEKLGIWIHNKTIQKARESLRVTEEHKIFLKGLVRKNEKVQNHGYENGSI